MATELENLEIQANETIDTAGKVSAAGNAAADELKQVVDLLQVPADVKKRLDAVETELGEVRTVATAMKLVSSKLEPIETAIKTIKGQVGKVRDEVKKVDDKVEPVRGQVKAVRTGICKGVEKVDEGRDVLTAISKSAVATQTTINSTNEPTRSSLQKTFDPAGRAISAPIAALNTTIDEASCYTDQVSRYTFEAAKPYFAPFELIIEEIDSFVGAAQTEIDTVNGWLSKKFEYVIENQFTDWLGVTPFPISFSAKEIIDKSDRLVDEIRSIVGKSVEDVLTWAGVDEIYKYFQDEIARLANTVTKTFIDALGLEIPGYERIGEIRQALVEYLNSLVDIDVFSDNLITDKIRSLETEYSKHSKKLTEILPQTAADIHSLDDSLTDGVYTLYIGHDPGLGMKLFCSDVQSNQPLEFLEVDKEANYTVWPATASIEDYKSGEYEGNCVGETIVTKFSKVQIDAQTLAVDRKTGKFGSSTGGFSIYWDDPEVDPTKHNRNFYASAQNCKQHDPGSDPGISYIDLTGTGFVIDLDRTKWVLPTCTSYGWMKWTHLGKVELRGCGSPGEFSAEPLVLRFANQPNDYGASSIPESWQELADFNADKFQSEWKNHVGG